MESVHLVQRLMDFIAEASRPLLVILGPTASGKTALSIDLAKIIPGVEIINADSRQLYRHLNIGTAKITTEEMRGIPHHLIDVLDPNEEATAAWYRNEATGIIDEIHSRGHVPMLVGGSMLYISAVTDDLEFPADRALRRPLQARRRMPLRKDLCIIGIDRPRGELTKRINERTAQLFAKGWVEEVRALLAMGYTASDPAMKSHGYREIMHWLCHGEHANHDRDARHPSQAHPSQAHPSQAQDDTLRMLQEKIAAKTRQYAKRQMTWWRGDDRIQWITP